MDNYLIDRIGRAKNCMKESCQPCVIQQSENSSEVANKIQYALCDMNVSLTMFGNFGCTKLLKLF